MRTTTDQTPAADPRPLAATFAAIIREWAGDDLPTIVERNKTYPASVCATHDFFDANDAMIEAFDRCGLPTDSLADDEDSCRLWGAAWTLAKNSEFTLSEEA